MSESFGLPRPLKDGLLLRWATPADTETLADFNLRMHSDDLQNDPEYWLKDWTRQLMSGDHPTTGPDDFTVVVTENGQIVSSSVLISQTWAYDGVGFGCGRPELVGTEEAYRRQGLVRAQMEVLHAKSEARGELVQAITGIPWYYRQFGYEMALDLGGSRRLDLDKIKPLAEGQEERYYLRPAGLADLPVLRQLYDIHTSSSLLKCVRDEAIWRYELGRPSERHINDRDLHLVETVAGEVAGYLTFTFIPKSPSIREIAVLPGVSLRDVALFAVRQLKARLATDERLKNKNAAALNFYMGRAHPVYDALAPELDQPRKPYAWYLRVPDLAAFLWRIAPALEARLAASVVAGHSGALKLNLYRSQLRLEFENGRLIEIEPYRPTHFFDGSAFFPDLTFLQLLFGYRSRQELEHARADIFVEDLASGVLMDALFPKMPSTVRPLAYATSLSGAQAMRSTAVVGHRRWFEIKKSHPGRHQAMFEP